MTAKFHHDVDLQQLAMCLEGACEDWPLVKEVEDSLWEHAKTGRRHVQVHIIIEYGDGFDPTA